MVNRPTSPIKVVLLGATGQVGWELKRSLLAVGEVYPFDSSSLNLLDFEGVRDRIRTIAPQVVVNAAAYTKVELAESERDACYTINALVPRLLAEEVERIGAWIVHYSTDYVFDGTKTTLLKESDACNPINYYGKTKLAGDNAIFEGTSKHLIFRVSWVYAQRRHNFLRTIVRRLESEKRINVVSDQTGVPTWARYIADITMLALNLAVNKSGNRRFSGLYNLVPSGAATWFDFACSIKRYIGSSCEIVPVTSEEYGSKVERPPYTALSPNKIEKTFGVHSPSWEECLRLCIDEMRCQHG